MKNVPLDFLKNFQQTVEKKPVLCASIAAAAGFILAGGLFTPVVSRLLRRGVGMGLQMSLGPLLSAGLAKSLSSTNEENLAETT